MSILQRTNASDLELSRDDSEGRTVHGIVVPFGPTIEVDDGFGRFKERFDRGAFTRTIAERGSRVKLLVSHQHRSLPIGKAVELREDAAGLFGAFRVSKTPEGDNALELVRDGVVDSFSVGFVPVRDRRHGDVTVRIEVALREASLVAFPAYEGALIAGVRAESHPTPYLNLARRRLELLQAETGQS